MNSDVIHLTVLVKTTCYCYFGCVCKNNPSHVDAGIDERWLRFDNLNDFRYVAAHEIQSSLEIQRPCITPYKRCVRLFVDLLKEEQSYIAYVKDYHHLTNALIILLYFPHLTMR